MVDLEYNIVGWKERNDMVFGNRGKDPMEVVDENKVLSWRWGVCKMKHDSLSLL